MGKRICCVVGVNGDYSCCREISGNNHNKTLSFYSKLKSRGKVNLDCYAQVVGLLFDFLYAHKKISFKGTQVHPSILDRIFSSLRSTGQNILYPLLVASAEIKYWTILP